MRIVALLPPESLTRVREAFPEPANQVVSEYDVDSLSDRVHRMRPDALVVDPDLGEESRLSEVLLGLSGRPIVIYATLTSASARAIAMCNNTPLAGMILRGYDDSTVNLVRTLRQAPRVRLGFLMVEAKAASIDDLPAALRRGTIAAFCATRPLRSVTQFAGIARLSRRSIDRWFFKVGLGSATRIIRCANLLRAYSNTREYDLSLTEIAMKSGFGSLSSLKRAALSLTGRTLHEVLHEVSLSDLISVVGTGI